MNKSSALLFSLFPSMFVMHSFIDSSSSPFLFFPIVTRTRIFHYWRLVPCVLVSMLRSLSITRTHTHKYIYVNNNKSTTSMRSVDASRQQRKKSKKCICISLSSRMRREKWRRKSRSSIVSRACTHTLAKTDSYICVCVWAQTNEQERKP